jgi:hypothetical protein
MGPKMDDLEVEVDLGEVALLVDLGEVALLLDLDFFVGEVEAVGVVGLFAARAGVEVRLEELPFPLPAFLSPRCPPLPPMVVRPRWLGLRGDGVAPASFLADDPRVGEDRRAAAATRAEMMLFLVVLGGVLLVVGEEMLAALAREDASLLRVGVKLLLLVVLALLLMDLLGLVLVLLLLFLLLLGLVGGDTERRDTLSASSSVFDASSPSMLKSGRGAVVPWVMVNPLSVGESSGSGEFFALKRMVWFANSLESPLKLSLTEGGAGAVGGNVPSTTEPSSLSWVLLSLIVDDGCLNIPLGT